MFVKHSRVIGVICAALNTLPLFVIIVCEVYILCFSANADAGPQGFAPFLTPSWIIHALLVSAAGFLGCLLARKLPMAGVTLMIVSGSMGLVFSEAYWWLGIPPLLLIAAGMLAYFYAKTYGRTEENGNLVRRRLIIKRLSRVFGMVGGALTLLLSLLLTSKYFHIPLHYDFSFFAGIIINLIPTAGLAGSLLINKNPMLAGFLMLIPGMLMVGLSPHWYYMIAPAVLAVAGAFSISLQSGDSKPPAG